MALSQTEMELSCSRKSWLNLYPRLSWKHLDLGVWLRSSGKSALLIISRVSRLLFLVTSKPMMNLGNQLVRTVHSTCCYIISCWGDGFDSNQPDNPMAVNCLLTLRDSNVKMEGRFMSENR